ncbi:Ca(2+)/calmodulin-responsive adenylate cyclase-like isoform X3 [Varroa destructor]|uniref:adenylate cyclase n=1 Tax=Varroa destructor TaxID=109461 RepID=A0A7M7MAU9_VARDE|nr:Ca(2+)/calmodulin-responsive adenylate cyclase-like isoform X3 [Varroa destructor]XP_022648584.1 Ca(2+)/calmodulin-responsive adenylate cyclase-like isoform X3 [Varroa destructor]XP_022648585.1 Ca(2+)/calmodulin-responsive adenylate cyclase-like isoform X3 [Varroa destructor]
MDTAPRSGRSHTFEGRTCQQALHRIAGHSGPIVWAEWSHSNDVIITCSLDGSLSVWDAMKGALLRSIRLQSNTHAQQQLSQQQMLGQQIQLQQQCNCDPVLCAAFQPANNNMLAMGSGRGMIQVISVSTGMVVRGGSQQLQSGARALSMAFSICGTLLWVGDDKGSISSYVFDIASGRLSRGRRFCAPGGGPVTCLSFRHWVNRQARDPCLLFGANVAIFLCVNVIGLTMHRILERGMCKSFLDIRNSILVRMDMAAENERLERLLLSILPQPIAAEMKKDTVNPRIIGEFHRVYMQKHESATILFADIVGFTVLSASVTPLELVNILNDLFGTFDHLSKKNGCVRIKLLGDCYYCVAGLTKERPDHALCGVQMGLDIIQAVAEIRKRKDIPCTLNMRVGLHTGKVLSGVIGLRKWQYDVWSNDVTIANQMESAGQPGKVHISDSTFALLEGAFPVEPGQTNAVLKRFGVVKTYFIVPRPNCEKICSGSVDSLDSEGEDTLQSHELGDARAQLTDVSRASLKLAIEARVLQQTNPHLINVWTLAFKERNTEKKFNLHQDVEYVTSISCLLFVHAFLNILSLLMLPRTELLWLISLLFVLWVVLIMVVISEARFEGHCLQITYFSVIRVPACTIAILLLFFAVFLNLLTCYPDIEHCSLTTLPDSYLLLPFLERDPSRNCSAPSYVFLVGTLCIISVAVFRMTPFLVKAFLLLFLCSFFVIFVMITHPTLFDCFDENNDPILPSRCTGIIYLAATSLAVLLQARQAELTARLDYLLQSRTNDEQRERHELKEGSRRIVFNLLPAHVAIYFLLRKVKSKDLYYKDYHMVGVLFARISNFAEFRIKQERADLGFDCLQFLNEIIAEFDKLLDWDHFQAIEKIKTMGAAYMCVVGLIPEYQIEVNDHRSEVEYMTILGDFFFMMLQRLQEINRRSAKSFRLQAGIHCGPVVAGVIGSRKPHYDIWGNTVNVASRMETNSRSESCLVTADVYKLLSDNFKFEGPYRKIVKGKGSMETYYLVAAKAERKAK